MGRALTRDHEAQRRERQPDHAERRRRRTYDGSRQRAHLRRHDPRRPGREDDLRRERQRHRGLGRGRRSTTATPGARRAASTTPRATSPTRARPATRTRPAAAPPARRPPTTTPATCSARASPTARRSAYAYDGQGNEIASDGDADRDERRLPALGGGERLRRRRPGAEPDRRRSRATPAS